MNRHFLLASCLIIAITLSACKMVKETRKTDAPDLETITYTETEEINDDDKYDVETNGEDVPYQETAKRLSDLLHTKLEVSFDWVKHYLFGKATLTLKPYFYPTNTLTLDAKGFDIQKVALVTASGNKDLKYEYDSMKLDIQLNKTYTRTDTFTIFIQYTAKPDELDEKNEYITYQNKGLYFVKQGEDDSSDNPQQLWTQGETEAASCWFPTIDHPNERTTQEISITVPNNYLTLSNGKLISSTNLPNGTRTDYWKQALPHAPYLFTMAIDEYVLVKDSWRGKEVNYYLDSTYAHLAHNIFGNTPEMLEFFSNKLNYPYPWDKYSQAIVYNFVAGAMENTSATLFYDDLYYYGTQEGKSDDIISHELFHHWFGDLVTCESWANLPLNESFATYGEYLWYEYKYGKKEADMHIANDLLDYIDESLTKKEPLIRYHHNDREEMFDNHSYQKGGRVLHMLRNYVGDEAFFASLNRYLTQNAYQSVEIHNLRLAFEEVTGEDLNWFFDQWFLSKGHPILDISQQYDSLTNKLIFEVHQAQPENTVFRIPTYIDIYHADGTKERKSILINQVNNVFEFGLKSKPVNVVFDPDRVILCEKHVEQDKHGYLHQFYNGSHFLDQLDALVNLVGEQQTDPKVRQMYIDAINNDFWAVRQEAIYYIEPSTDAAQNTKLKNAFVNLLHNDKNLDIKTTVLDRMAELFGEDTDLLPLFNELLKDDQSDISPSVLYYLNELYPDAALQQANKLSQTTNNNMAATIAGIFAGSGTAENQSFFETRLPVVPDNILYSFIDSYGYFLSRMESPTLVQKGILTLQKIALTNPNWWLKLVATQQVAFVKDVFTDIINEGGNDSLKPLVESLNNSLQHIKNTETDPKLLEQYTDL